MLNNPFGPAELETILRPFDRDASGLPSRLVGLHANGVCSLLQAKRYELTTESWDTPAPSVAVPMAARVLLCDELWDFISTTHHRPVHGSGHSHHGLAALESRRR